VELKELTLRNFRNLSPQKFAFGSATNVVLGANGAGKTSLLEALVVLGNLRSFRAPHLRRVVRHDQPGFQLKGEVAVGSRTHRLEQTVEIGPPISRDLRLDGVAVDVEHYLQYLPIFALTAQDCDLVAGPPEGRRAFLDRFIFLLRPTYIDLVRSYRRLLRQRNAALVSGSSEAEVEAWEELLAAAASELVLARHDGAGVVAQSFANVWNALSVESAPEIVIEYRSEPWNRPAEGPKKVEELYRQRYNETRTRDRQMGFTVDGPHRHDLSIKTAGRSVRHVLSSGQTKGVAAALRLATLAQVERERDERFPVIVDDVDAELDATALTRLVEQLGGERQLFLSSTSEQVAEMAGARGRCIWLENGNSICRENVTDD
jgi:DNA replication and repair protein RecF